MNYEYTKATPIRLRNAGKDEKWLQDAIVADPTILGFGDVLVVQRERPQPTGGRIDLILADPEEEMRFEVEIMLGAVDESHIIRTIEYWDVERRRYPSYEHRAVIVAEEITNRFFNVISLLNRSVPIVAVQLNAFLLDDKLALNFVTVLDVTEEGEEDAGETVDRKSWEHLVSKESLALMDAIIGLVPTDAGAVQIKYNRGHVAIGTSGRHFCWFHPRKAPRIHFNARLGEEERQQLLAKLEERGIECVSRKSEFMRIVLGEKEFDENKELIGQVVSAAELYGRK